MRSRHFVSLLFLAILLLSCKQEKTFAEQFINSQRINQTQVPVYTYQVIKTYPHDPTSFTEGLVFYDGYLYESTGLYEKSKLRKIDLNSGKILQEYKLPEGYFGEGITILNNKIYQLTYTSNIGFIYDKNTFTLEKTFSYKGEGWGLTNDNKWLIMDNGSASLLFINPNNFHIEKVITAHDSKGNISFLNELEYIDGKIYANVWQSNYIAVVSPKDGQILGWIDLTGLKPKTQDSQNPLELNGIAYLPQNKLLLVTGKDWPSLYAIKLISHKFQ